MQIVQNFFDGINRAVSREEFFNPREFYTLANARILESGNLGEIVRIKGFSQINALADLATVYDMALVNNSSVGTTNLYLIFYKNTGGDYVIKILDTDGTVVETFTYSSTIEPSNGGELKQHENTIFVSPHNKLIYGVNSNFYIKDFISEIPKIKTITLDQLADNAIYDLTVASTLDSGYLGKKSEGRISYGGEIDTKIKYNFRIKIGDIQSNRISGSFASAFDLMNKTYDVLTTTTALTDLWDFELVTYPQNKLLSSLTTGTSINFDETFKIIITSKGVGSEFNQTISLLNNDLNGEDNNAGRASFKTGGGAIQEKTTFRFINPVGGSSGNTVYGSVRIATKNSNITDPIEISSVDSIETLRDKFFTILSSSKKFIEDYDIEKRDTTTIRVEAKKGGVEYNTNFTLQVNSETDLPLDVQNDLLTISTLQTGKASGDRKQTIKADTEYWYKARFRFVDGHLTETCAPALLNSGANQPINVVFDVSVKDLDNNDPRLQIFRKEDSGEFFLIKEVNFNDADNTIIDNEYTFVDTGFSVIEAFTISENIWTKEHKTQEVMDNRYIKGNITFFDDKITVSPSDFTLSLITAGDQVYDVSPYNTKTTVYVQPQYVDGSKGYFTEIGDINIEDANQKLQIQQTRKLSGVEKTISELKFYSDYVPFGEKQNVRFTTPEIITPNLGSIEDPLLFSTTTKVFFGYKYILEVPIIGGTRYLTKIKDWHNPEEDLGWRLVWFQGAFSSSYVGFNTVNGQKELDLTIGGEVFKYVPVAEYEGSSGKQILYKLDIFGALEEAVSTGELKVQLTGSGSDSLSSKITDDRLKRLKVKVNAIDDKTGNINYFTVKEFGLPELPNKMLDMPEDTRLYLTLESSNLDEIDNPKINEYDRFINEWERKDRPNTFGPLIADTTFEILNFELKNGPVYPASGETRIQRTFDGEDFFLISGIESSEYYLINEDLRIEDTAIYLGSKTNEVDVSGVTLDTTGFRREFRSNIFYSTLASYNIYEKIVKESDFNFIRQEFANQIIWSSPLQDANYFSGGRNFAYTNFYNVPTENGEIIDIFSLGGNLYVFCEKGVARLLVGETLTQQKSGQVFVDSTNFITKHLWMMENMSPIKKGSIAKYEGSLYFTDGTDVYRLGGDGAENISLGVLNLTESDNYVGTIVKKYDEYRLTNLTDGETFVYNTKFKKWYGPHTYVPQKTVEIGGDIVSFDNTAGRKLIKEDVGNTFAGTAFTTLIQSVGNDTETGAIDKTYRKFYIDMTGTKVSGFLPDTTLKYGKDYTALETVELDDATKVHIKNDRYNVGIKNSKGNTKKIYWDIETTNDGFRLKGFRTAYIFRRRR